MAEMIVGSYVLAGKVSLLFSQIMKKVAHCHALWIIYSGWQSESFVPTEESLLPCQSPGWQLSVALAGVSPSIELRLELVNHFYEALFGSYFRILNIFEGISFKEFYKFSLK